MITQFQLLGDNTYNDPRGVTLTLPGGLLVPETYTYVDTGGFLIEQCQAAWDTFGGDELPLAFRLVGPPGGGKNAVVYALAARRQQPLQIVQGHEEVTAEDLVVSAAVGSGGKVSYIASPLLAAMIEGGICFIDEIAKMRPRALAPLSSVLDERRSISSALLGITFKAHANFRFCAAYNPTDADAFDLAPWLKRRTLPELEVALPDLPTLEKIVHAHDQVNDGVASEVMKRLRQKPKQIALDAGTVRQLVTYVRRLQSFEADSGCDFGDIIELAIKQITGNGLDSQRKRGRG
jgi:hypothetical protein